MRGAERGTRCSSPWPARLERIDEHSTRNSRNIRCQRVAISGSRRPSEHVSSSARVMRCRRSARRLVDRTQPVRHLLAVSPDRMRQTLTFGCTTQQLITVAGQRLRSRSGSPCDHRSVRSACRRIARPCTSVITRCPRPRSPSSRSSSRAYPSSHSPCCRARVHVLELHQTLIADLHPQRIEGYRGIDRLHSAPVKLLAATVFLPFPFNPFDPFVSFHPKQLTFCIPRPCPKRQRPLGLALISLDTD